MKFETFAISLLVLLLAFYAGWYFYDQFDGQLSPDSQLAGEPAPSDQSHSASPAASQRHPLPPRHPVALPEKQPEERAEAPTEPPFPSSLEQSDGYLKQRVGQLIKQPELRSLLLLKHFIQKLVVTIDTLPEANIPRQHLPIKPPAAGFLTIGRGDEQLISKANARRYTIYVKLFEALPDDVLLHIYRGLYPLFQQAYRQTGNRSGYFNDRLIQVMDHLLLTPELDEPLKVVRHIRRFKVRRARVGEPLCRTKNAAALRPREHATGQTEAQSPAPGTGRLTE